MNGVSSSFVSKALTGVFTSLPDFHIYPSFTKSKQNKTYVFH